MDISRYVAGIVQKVTEFVLNKKFSHGKILTFHQVCDDQSKWDGTNCAITQKGFNKLIETLKIGNAEILQMDMLPDCRGNQQTVWLTFDDAYEDVYTNVYPLLLKNKMPFAVFLTVELLDQQKYLKTEQVQEMLASGLCVVGAHTVSHGMLSKMTSEKARKEIFESKAQLEKIFSITVDIMAYPYGSVYACRKRHRRDAELAGYRMAFSTIDSTLPAVSDAFFLPRINVNENNYLWVASR